MSSPDGGAAFPCWVSGEGHRGMTLRDYFAGQALAGMSWYPWSDKASMEVYDEYRRHAARTAYGMADALLVARGAP